MWKVLSRLMLSALLVSSSFAVASCSSFRAATGPGGTRAGTDGPPDGPLLEERARARVYLPSGEVQDGEVVAVADSSVTLGRPGNYGYVETTYAFDDILRCEVETSPLAQEIVIGSVIGLGVVAGILLMWSVSGIGDGW